jgi:hypothetical protein
MNGDFFTFVNISIFLQQLKNSYCAKNVCVLQSAFVNIKNTVSAAYCDLKQGNVFETGRKSVEMRAQCLSPCSPLRAKNSQIIWSLQYQRTLAHYIDRRADTAQAHLLIVLNLRGAQNQRATCSRYLLLKNTKYANCWTRIWSGVSCNGPWLHHLQTLFPV